MLAAIRSFAKSWVAVILFMLLLVSLIIWGGMSDMFKNPINTAVIKAGSHEISGPQFENIYNQNLERIAKEQNGGQPITPEQAVAARIPQGMLQQFASEVSLAEAIRKLGIRPAAALVSAQLQKIPSLFDEITGKFDKGRYQQFLQQNKMTDKEFTEAMTDDISSQHMTSGFMAGLKPPLVYGALIAIQQFEQRSWSSFPLNPAKYAPAAPPTDAQIQAMLTELGDRVKKPETRTLSIIRFSTQAAEPAVKVDPAEVEKLYNFRKETMSMPETRTIVQIPAKTQAQAQTAAQRLGKGEDPAAIAKSLGVDPIHYDKQPKTAIGDRKVADVAFSLPAGQVSGAIQGDLGFAVVKVLEVNPGQVTTLETARPVLEKQVRHDTAQKQVYAQVEAYQKAHDSGAQMNAAAQAAKAEVVVAGPVSAQGRDADGKPVAMISKTLIDKAFAMAQGEESEVEDEGNGEYFVVRVDKVTPSAMPTVAEARALGADKAWTTRQTQLAMKKASDDLVARIRKGESFEAVAASAGAPVSHTVGLDRAGAQPKVQELGQQLLQGVYSGAKGDVIVTPGPNNAMVISRIDSIVAGDPARMAPIAVQARDSMGRSMVADLSVQARETARRVIKPKIDTKRAAQAINLQPDDLNMGAPAAKKDEAPKPKAKG